MDKRDQTVIMTIAYQTSMVSAGVPAEICMLSSITHEYKNAGVQKIIEKNYENHKNIIKNLEFRNNESDNYRMSGSGRIHSFIPFGSVYTIMRILLK